MVNNNRTYLNDEHHPGRRDEKSICRKRPRGDHRLSNIDFLCVARNQGAWGASPIMDPSELGNILDRAEERVQGGGVA